MNKTPNLDGKRTQGEWWKHLKWMKRVVNKETRRRDKIYLRKMEL
jgi:hypothetical protein